MHRFLVALLALFAFCPTALRAEAPFNFDTTPGKLPKDIVPVQYDLSLTPDIAKRTFTGQETIEITVKQATARCVLNAESLEISAVELTPVGTSAGTPGEPPPPAAKPSVALDPAAQTCTLTFPAEIPPGTYRLALRFSGQINQDGAGLFASTYDGANGKPETMLCTQMEPTDARRLFPCWDEPAFRAKFHLVVNNVPTGMTAVSNMPVSGVVGFAEGAETWGFQTTPPMASYLLVLAIGNFDTIEGESDGTKIHVIAPRGRVQNGKYALESAEKILHYYNEYFGVKFPLPKLDLIAVSGGGSFGGAMENWGGIVFSESALLYDPAASSQATKQRVFAVVAHEMAHQWFGDLVTMAWWDNLWLNEGFASWLGESATDHFNPDWDYWHTIASARDEAMASDARSTTHPIQQPVENEMDAERAFDEITYQKGQAFLRMMENYLRPDVFRDGLHRYMQAHAYGNTTTADLWAALDAASGQPVSAIAAQWTERPGFPLVRVSRDSGKPDEIRYAQRRFTMHDPAAAPLHWIVPVTYLVLSDAPASNGFLLDADKTESFPASSPPVKINAGGGGYYRVSYDKSLLNPLLDHFNDLQAADQYNLLTDAWAEVRADFGPLSAYAKMAGKLHPESSQPYLWTQVCGVIGSLDHLFVGGDPAARTAWEQAGVYILRPVFEHLGWQAGAEESTAARDLRSTLIHQLGFLDDPLMLGACRERFAAFVKDPSALPPDIRAAVCEVVGRRADAAAYDELLAQARRAASDEQKQLFYHSLACSLDPALAQRTMDLAASDEIQSTVTFRLLSTVAGDGEQPAAVVKFTLDHRAALMKKVSPMAKNLAIPNLYNAFTDAPRADELENYAKQPGAVADPTQVKKVAENIRINAELKARLLPQIKTMIEGK